MAGARHVLCELAFTDWLNKLMEARPWYADSFWAGEVFTVFWTWNFIVLFTV